MELLTVKEAATMLNVTTIHLRNLINKGKIPYINIASVSSRRSIRIERSKLEEFIQGGGTHE